jgi:uncharacterized protein
MKLVILTLLSFLVAQVCKSADILEKELRGKDFNYSKEEISELVRKTEAGDLTAMNTLGLLYYYGRGVPEDESRGIELISAAAEKGHAPAQTELGCRHIDGRGVEKDFKAAVRLFRAAADKEHPPAQSFLGDCYHDGTGVPKDYALAISWYRKAASHDDLLGLFNLGSCYLFGEGVVQDLAEAEKWWRKAAEGGHDASQFMLAMVLSENQTNPNGAEIFKWFKRASNQGYSAAQVKLGELYSKGRFVEGDLVQAYKWFNLAAAEGEEEAGKQRDEVEKRMTVDMINDAQKASRAFKPVLEYSSWGP